MKSGLVISSSPRPGEQVKPGSSVDLVISSGDVEVPDVVGKSRDSARDELINLGLKVKSPTEATDAQDPGNVVSQSLPPGSKVSSGSTITIVIAKKPKQTPTPTPTTTEPTVSPSPTTTSPGNP